MKSEEIQELKKEKKYIFDNINYIKAISVKLYPNTVLYSLECCYFYLFYSYDIEYINKNQNILINNYIKKRKDYKEINERLKGILNNRYNLINIYTKFKILKVPPKLIKLIYILYKNKSLNIRIFSLILMLKELYIKIKKINFKEELFISFCDAHCEENLLTQYFNNIEVKTLTLQHGQYRFLKPGFETADAEAYLNFCSNYLLSWGEKTKIEMEKGGVSKEKILLCGALKEFTDISKKALSFANNNIFGIILNGETYRKSNITMINIANKIAEKYNLKYIIRLHPMNNIKVYEKFINKSYFIKYLKNISGEEYSSQVNFSLLHMTGVFVEMLSIKSPFFVLEDEYTEEIFKLEGLYFSNLEEFNKIYEEYRENNEKMYIILDKEYKNFNIAQNEKELNYLYLKNINNLL